MVDICISNYTPSPILICRVLQSHEVLQMYLLFFSMMEKTLKNYACRFHIQLDGNNKLKEHGIGFLEKGIDCTKVVCMLLELGQPML